MAIDSIDVEVWTRDEDNAGTDSKVECTVRFNGAPEFTATLDVPGVNNFRRGAKEVFSLQPLPPSITGLSPDDVLGITIRSLAKPLLPGFPAPTWKTAAVGLRVNGSLVMSRWAWKDLPRDEIRADRRFSGTLDALELELITGDMQHGGTDDPVYCSVRLSDGADVVTDLRLDYPGENDFERGATRRYLLPLPSDLPIAVTPAQVDRISIRKGGDDGWLLGGVVLYANGRQRFRNASVNQFLDSGAAVLRLRSWVSDRVAGPVLGGLGSDIARVQARLETPGSVELRLTDPSGAVASAAAPVTPAGVVQVGGLSPDTCYSYQLYRSGNAIPNTDGQLRTFPKEVAGGRFSFAFGSCVRNKYDTSQQGWEQLLRLAADPVAPTEDGLRFFVHLGDTFYFYDADVLGTGDVQDAPEASRAIAAAHLSSRLHPSFLRMARVLPTVAVWDDHDFRGNNSLRDGFSAVNVARDTFLSYWGNPDLGSSWRQFGLTSRVSFGRVDVYLMDCRFNRSAAGFPNCSYFGQGQCDLVLSEIDARAKALGPRLVFLAAGGPWNAMDRTDSYSQRVLLSIPIYAAERTRFFSDLAARVEDGRIRGLVLLSGDIHRAEICEVELGAGVVAPELISSSLAMPHSPTEGHDLEGERLYSRGVSPDDGSYANFCCVTVDTTAKNPNGNWSLTATFRRSDNGEAFMEKTYHLTGNQFRW